MAKRKGLSPSIRFEVFKRDLFTCQYCGRKAPDVVLEVDHINAVAKGGSNAIENLVTSCWDCNHGKRDKSLSDVSEVEKSRRQLELLQEKKNMVDLIMKWKESMNSTDDYMIDKIQDLFFKTTGIQNRCFSDSYKATLKSTIKTCGFDIVVDAVYKSIESYYRNDINNVENTISKIIGIARNVHDETSNPDKASMRKLYHTVNKKFYVDQSTFYAKLTYCGYKKELESHVLQLIPEAYSQGSFYKALYDLFSMS